MRLRVAKALSQARMSVAIDKLSYQSSKLATSSIMVHTALVSLGAHLPLAHVNVVPLGATIQPGNPFTLRTRIDAPCRARPRPYYGKNACSGMLSLDVVPR